VGGGGPWIEWLSELAEETRSARLDCLRVSISIWTVSPGARLRIERIGP